MAKFTVSGSIEVPISFNIQVDAETEEQAKDQAIDLLLKKKQYSVHDFDGNRVDFDPGDIDIYDVEKEK